MYSQEQVIAKLRQRIATDFKGKQGRYADHLGLSSSYLSKVLSGSSQPSARLLDDLDLVKTTVFCKGKRDGEAHE